MPKASKQATNGPERSIKSKRTEELRVECVIKTKSQKKEIKQKIRKRKELKKVVSREIKTKKTVVHLERTQESYCDFNLLERWNNQPVQEVPSEESLMKILEKEYTLLSHTFHKELYEERLLKKKMAAEKEELKIKEENEKIQVQQKLEENEKIQVQQKLEELEKIQVQQKLEELEKTYDDKKENVTTCNKKKRKIPKVEPLPESHFIEGCVTCAFIKEQQAFMDSLTSEEEYDDDDEMDTSEAADQSGYSSASQNN